MTYYERNKENLKKYSRNYHKSHREEINIRKRNPGSIRVTKVLGVRLKGKKLKPFNEKISPELKAKMEENTRTNDERIKFFTLTGTKEDHLARRIVRGLIRVKGG